jgi:hypothetical protein
MASKTLIECQEKVDKLLLDNLSTELSPTVVDQIMCQVQQEVIRAYHIGQEQMQAVLDKEVSDRQWERDAYNGQQMGA